MAGGKYVPRAGYELQTKPCSICGKPPKAKGLCYSHYTSERRRINVAAMKNANQSPIDEYWAWLKKELNLK